MGYYTCYRMEVIEGDHNLISQLREENEDAAYALDEEGNFANNCKWYESDSDMKAFSEKHPKALFLLEGDGEDSPDYWRQYWKNGKCQNVQGEIVYEEFDETKMK